jgi:hypothetical protein
MSAHSSPTNLSINHDAKSVTLILYRARLVRRRIDMLFASSFSVEGIRTSGGRFPEQPGGADGSEAIRQLTNFQGDRLFGPVQAIEVCEPSVALLFSPNAARSVGLPCSSGWARL